MAESDTQGVFVRALNVMNAALDAHRDDFPYRQIISASEKLLEGKEMGVEVYGDDPKSPFDFHTVRWKDGRLEYVGQGKRSPDAVWKVTREYLEKVSRDSDEYVEHPEKLDWDWLKTRLGVGLE